MIELPFTDENAAALGIDVSHYFAGKCYAKEVRMRPGTYLESHLHPFPHLSILVSGKVRLEAGKQIRTLNGYECVTIEQDVVHKITAISESIWLCIHAVDPEYQDPATVDEAILKG